jgi:protein TonB
MQPRKTKNADIERLRGTFFLLGLVLSLGAVLLAFQWKTEVKNQEVLGTLVTVIPDDFYIPNTERKKEPEPPAIKEAVLFDLVTNDTEIIEEAEFFGSDITDETNFSLDNFIISQTKKEIADDTKIYNFVEKMPEFPGGELALLSYLNKSVKYPVIAQENGVQGKVYISFVIDTDGSVTNVIVSRPCDMALNNEALRVVKSMPNWNPGMQGGRKVRVNYTVPINFTLR